MPLHLGLIRAVATIALLFTFLFQGVAVRSTTAQDELESEVIIRTELEDGAYPIAPSFVRLLRINLEEGASSPLHTHPGPELAFIEQGTLTVEVNGVARLTTAAEAESEEVPSAEGTPVAQSEAPTNAEFELTAGDQIVYLPQTPMTFRNGESDQVSILSSVLLPAGNQHPPGITYLTGQPPASAFEGVNPEILGDGVATVLPTGGIILTVERLTIRQGDPVPAFTGPILLSLERGVFDFTVVGGKVQVSRTSTPGPQPDTAPETNVSLSKGDAVFFPLGMEEVDRSDSQGDLVLLRMTIQPLDPDAQESESDSGIGIIDFAPSEDGPPAEEPDVEDGTPIAEEDQQPVEGDDEEAEATPTAEPEEPEVRTAEVNSEGVNVRTGPGIDFEIATQLFTGQLVTVTGDPEDADGFTWYPIDVVDEPGVSGFIAAEFIDFVEE